MTDYKVLVNTLVMAVAVKYTHDSTPTTYRYYRSLRSFSFSSPEVTSRNENMGGIIKKKLP